MPCCLPIVVLMVPLLASAGTTSRAREIPPRSREVRDSTGEMVLVPAHPQRVLSLCTSATDTILRLGEGARLAGIDEYSRVVPGATNLAVLGRGSALSREQVLARRIDLAFVWWFQDDVAKLLADLHVPVIKLRCGRATEVPTTLRLVGECLGAPDAADALARSVTETLARLPRPDTNTATRVYFELYSPFKTSGRDSYLNDLIELAGGCNIAADATGPILLSSERLLTADPQCVILIEGFGTPEQFARRNGLASLSAVTTGRVRVLDRNGLVAGAGLPEGVAELRRLLELNPPTPP